MSHEKSGNDLRYDWRKGGNENYIKLKIGENRTDEYKVEHPKWELFAVEVYEIKADFGKLYGKRFSHLTDEKPHSIFMAKGSEVSVYKGEKM